MKLFDKTRKNIEEPSEEFATGEIPVLEVRETMQAADDLLEEVLLEEELLAEGGNLPPSHSETSLTMEDAEEEPVRPRSRRIRPEAIMAIIALLSAIALAAMVILCLPFMGKDVEEDPEALLKAQHAQQSTEPPTAPSEETIPEEPTEPTVHPEANPYDRLDFQYGPHNYLYCLRQKSYIGVDVSAFQREIDWQKVKDSGIDFAILRLGYRGYESGKLVKDEYIDRNLEETARVGMPIGVYFFSQALTIKEVDEEIDFMMEILGEYDIHMPIVLDWEIPTDTARTAQMDRRTLTELQRYFCETMTEKGYTPMIYFNWYQSKNLLHLDELEDYPFWLALYQDRMTYPYKVEMWQYTDKGNVPGIAGGVDLNVYLPEE